MAFVRKVLDTTDDNVKRIVKVGQRVVNVALKTGKIVRKLEETANGLKHQVRACVCTDKHGSSLSHRRRRLPGSLG